MPNTFGKHLRAVRQRQGMSLRSLAHLSEISLGYMHQIETGKASVPTPARIAEFAKWLKVDGDELAAFPDSRLSSLPLSFVLTNE